jgi:protein-disulfide isomerase
MMSKNQIYLLVGGGCLLALCAVAAMLIGTLYIAPKLINQTNPVQEAATVAPRATLEANSNSMGDPNAPIHIIEFGDFQCPYCKRFHTETEPLLIGKYIETGKVYFTYRSAGNWVSKNIGQGSTESQDAALAAYCAMDQNKFWEMHAALFANNRDVEDQGSFTSQRLTTIAKKTGLDMSTYQDCYDSGKYAGQVQQDYADTLAAGIQGTPSFIVIYQVNGVTKNTLIEGAQPFEAFQQAINEIFSEMGLAS